MDILSTQKRPGTGIDRDFSIKYFLKPGYLPDFDNFLRLGLFLFLFNSLGLFLAFVLDLLEGQTFLERRKCAQYNIKKVLFISCLENLRPDVGFTSGESARGMTAQNVHTAPST